MKVFLYYIGKAKDPHANAIAEDFLARAARYCRTSRDGGAEMREIRPERFDPAEKHAAARKIYLDPRGKALDSAAFAALVGKSETEGRDLVFLIGAHDGLPAGWAARADLLLSLSEMTFPHELARAMLAEQIYRAFATLRGIPTRANVERCMSWFKRDKPQSERLQNPENGERRVKTEGLWQKCEGCRQIIWKKDLESQWNVCPKCGHHFRLDAVMRLKMLFDDGEYEPLDSELTSSDPLAFHDSKPYSERLRGMQEATSLSDAIISAAGTLDGRRVQICSMDIRFIGGSMGCVVGEKIARAIDRCLEGVSPLIVVSASGGARMQEGAVSLMQMAKISASLMRLDEARIPFISVLTDPTTGGVTASYAMLGDLNIAEPNALIGFAGPRVIEQTIRQKLPEGFQRSEFLLKHGMLDAVVPRPELKAYIATALRFFVG